MNQLTLPIRNLLGQPIRSTLTILGIAVAIGGFVALKGLTLGFENSLDQGIEEPGADLVVSQRGTFGLITSSIPDSLGPKLAAIDGVEAASGVLMNMTPADNEANITMSGWPLASPFWSGVPLVSGRLPSGDTEWEVVLGQSIAEALNKRLGDQIELQYQTYRIVGIANFTTTLNQNIALVPLAGLQQLLGREGTLTFYQIRLQRPYDDDRMNAVRAKIAAEVPKQTVSNTAEYAHDIRLFRIIQAFTATISFLVLIMAVLGIANTLLMAVNERTHEFGILASLGWRPARTLTLVLLEGLIMSLLGGIIGIGLGVCMMKAVSLMKMASGLLEPHLTLGLIAQAVGSVLIIGPLGAVYPAWRAIRLSPAEALRRL